MKYDAVAFSWAGDKYLGRPYSEMDCQQFVENCMADVGLRENLKGSNTWYRHIMNNGWVGSPEECKKQFGQIPKGALLFILEHDGKEPEKYRKDGIGNASHIGIRTGRNDGAIHSSYTRKMVATSTFQDRTIPNGGWNRVGLYNKFTYGKTIDWILEHSGQTPDPGGDGGEEIPMQGTVWVESGETVNLRKKPNTSAALVDQIKIGSPATILDKSGDWFKVQTCGRTGWMKSEFIRTDGESDEDDQGGSGDNPEPADETDGEYIRCSRTRLMRVYDEIGDILGLRG